MAASVTSPGGVSGIVDREKNAQRHSVQDEESMGLHVVDDEPCIYQIASGLHEDTLRIDCLKNPHRARESRFL